MTIGYESYHLKTHKDYGYIWRKYAEKDKSASFRQRDQFIYLKDLFCNDRIKDFLLCLCYIQRIQKATSIVNLAT